MSNSTIWDVGSVFAMGAAPDSGSLWVQFVPFAIVLAIFYFIILLPMKRKQQKVSQFLESLKVNDRIVTTGGIYGQITRLGEQTGVATKAFRKVAPSRPIRSIWGVRTSRLP